MSTEKNMCDEHVEKLFFRLNVILLFLAALFFCLFMFCMYSLAVTTLELYRPEYISTMADYPPYTAAACGIGLVLIFCSILIVRSLRDRICFLHRNVYDFI